jgi:branched-chain amino acid transport system substrate-binding protein
MTKRSPRQFGLAALTAAGLVWTAHAQAADKTITIGIQCDRTGPTQIVGTALCPGIHDYISLVNAQGGIDGWKINDPEIDHEYKVPLGMEAYQRFKEEGAVGMMIYGTPQTQSVNQKLEQDKIPGTSPGFGIAAAAAGKYYQYLFPIAATYWSQAAAAVQFTKQQLGGSLQGKKIAFIFYDNPAGREPLPVLNQLAKQEGFQMKEYAVPPPGVDVSAQVLDISQNFRPDFVIDHLFGKAPALAIKGLKENGYPLDKVIAFVWASGEADIQAAGGWGVAQGYNTMQFAGAGQNYPVIDEIKAMYQKDGKGAPAAMESTVYYNRGVLTAAVWTAAIRNALKLTNDKAPTGTDIKHGFEMIRDFKLGGLVPPLTITPADHEGGGWVQIFRVQGNGFKQMTPWFRAYRSLIVAKADKTAQELAAK